MPAVCFWPRNTKCLIQAGLNAAPASPPESLAHGDVTVPPASLQSLSHVKYKDFILCLPVYLSQYILGKASLIFQGWFPLRVTDDL